MKAWYGIAAVTVMLVMGAGQVAQAADDYKSFGVRLRAIYVKPAESFDSRLSSLSPSLTDNIIPELDLEYFFTKNISAELIAGVTKHDLKLGANVVGSTYGLPPTITVKYHPLAGSIVSPYIGFGINAMFPFDSAVSG